MAQPTSWWAEQLATMFRPRRAERGPSDRVPRRRRRRAWLASVGIAGTVALALAGCTAANPDGGAASASSGSNASAASLSYQPCCSWPTATFSINPWNVNTDATAFSDFVFQRLAIQKFPSITEYAPQLASSWKVSGQTLTVNLEKKAKWQDGTPVTSKDVYDTVLLNGLNGAAAWNDITGVKIVDDSTVAFTLRQGEPVALAENDILANTVVYPASVYGSFVTPQVEKDVPAYYAVYNTDPAKAVTMPEYTRNNAVFKQLAALSPSKVPGDGPFKLQGVTGSEAKLVKSNTYWLADKIHVPSITYGNGSNQEIYPQLFSGNADFSNVYLAPPLLKRWNSTAGSNLALPQAFGFALAFNNQQYPLNLTPVRQALAYAIPRQQMTEAAYGSAKGAGGVWQQYITGLSPQQNSTYLTKSELSKLNKYNTDTSAAAKLLTGAGFTKKNGQWYTPKGDQFTLTFEANSNTSDIVTSFTSAAKALTEFGIKSDVNATSGAQLSADEMNGNFQIAGYFPSGATPLLSLSAMLHDQNFQTSGNYAGKKGMGFGPTADVPGLGNVDVATTIFNQSRTVGPGSKMNELTWSWAQLVNKQVPYIWYATKVYQFSFSDSHYTNWPKVGSNGTSSYWDIIGNNQSAGVVYAMENGYIQPK